MRFLPLRFFALLLVLNLLPACEILVGDGAVADDGQREQQHQELETWSTQRLQGEWAGPTGKLKATVNGGTFTFNCATLEILKPLVTGAGHLFVEGKLKSHPGYVVDPNNPPPTYDVLIDADVSSPNLKIEGFLRYVNLEAPDVPIAWEQNGTTSVMANCP